MRNLLKLEEATMFVLALFAFAVMNLSWWWFVVLLLSPDLSAIGYLAGPRVGAFTYNLAHHKGVAILLYLAGVVFYLQSFALAGVILFAHSSLDRVLGFGLKYPDSFQNTHLGLIGKTARP